jgi:type II secretory pathway component GspD/PulD (secretin)
LVSFRAADDRVAVNTWCRPLCGGWRASEQESKVNRRQRFLVVAGVAATFACPWPHAFGAEPKWPPGPYTYLVLDQDTKDVLQEFGSLTSIPVAVSEQVKGHLRGPLPITTAKEFLKGLCENQGLDWYFDGTKLYVSAASEVDSVVVNVAPLRLQDLADRLDKLGIADLRYPLTANQKGDVVRVSGPPRYLALVKQTYDAMKSAIPRPTPQSGVSDEPTVRVFRGSP